MIREPSEPPLMPRPVGAVLRARRAALARTLGEVARAAGCSRSYLSQIENARVAPPAEPLLTRLELALGLTPGELARPARNRRGQAGGGSSLRRDIARIESALARLTQWLVEPDADPGPGIPIIAGPGGMRERLGERPGERTGEEHLRVPGLRDPLAFALRLSGEVATPMYRPGDVIVFSPARPARSGSDCYVRLAGEPETDQGPGVFARVHFEGAGPVRLEPLAGSAAARLLPRNKIAGLHPAITIIRAIG